MTDRGDDDQWFRDWLRSGKPVGIMATVGTVIAIVVFAASVPRLEGMTIFRQNDIPPDLVTRDGQKLCWTRIIYKWRAPAVVDIDVDVDFLSAKTGKMVHQPAPALLSGTTGDEITSDDTPPAGRSLETRTCLMLSKRILPGQPIRVRQTAYFESVTGLYNVPVTLPTIIIPADQAWIFSQRHDSAPSPNDAVAGPPPAPPRPSPDKRSEMDITPDILRVLSPSRADVPDLAARVEARVPTDMAERIEDWRARRSPIPNRSQAIRVLLGEALDADDREIAAPYRPERR